MAAGGGGSLRGVSSPRSGAVLFPIVVEGGQRFSYHWGLLSFITASRSLLPLCAAEV